jgi:hypothetical protein
LLLAAQSLSLPVPPNQAPPQQLATPFEDFQRSLSPGGFEQFGLPGLAPLLSPHSAQTPLFARSPRSGSAASPQQQQPVGQTPSSQQQAPGQLRMQQPPQQQQQQQQPFDGSGGGVPGGGGSSLLPYGAGAPNRRMLNYAGLPPLQPQGGSPGLGPPSGDLLSPSDRSDREQSSQVRKACACGLDHAMPEPPLQAPQATDVVAQQSKP